MRATNKGRRREEQDATKEPEGIGTGEGTGSAEVQAPVQDAGIGEIERAVLKRHGIGIGAAAGYFSQIVAAAELGGASWEARLKAACRKGEK